jgi:hypothetical protein
MIRRNLFGLALAVWSPFSWGCGGGSDAPVVQLPDQSPPRQDCKEDADCADDAFCVDEDVCQAIWGTYLVSFERISIPQSADAEDADGSPPDVSCTLLRDDGSGNLDAGATMIVQDIYEGELSGGGYNEVGPNTTFRVRCYEGEEGEIARRIGESCTGPSDACVPMTRDILGGETLSLELTGGFLDSVVVDVRFEKFEQQ